MKLSELKPLTTEYDSFDDKLFLVSSFEEDNELFVAKVIGYNTDFRKWIVTDVSGDVYEANYCFEIPENITLDIAIQILNYHPQFESKEPVHETIRTIHNWKFYLGSIFGYALDTKAQDNIVTFLLEDDDFWSVQDIEINKAWFQDIIKVLTMSKQNQKKTIRIN